MPRPRVPKEDSSFGCLPPDLAHLVLTRIASLSHLLHLKCVSRGVANAARRVIHSESFMRQSHLAYDDMESALRECKLSLPLQLSYNFRHPAYFMLGVDEAPTDVLVLHAFHLQFRYRHSIITDPTCAISWCLKAIELRNTATDDEIEKHLSEMSVVCTQFSVERPGIDIFHSVDALWNSLGVHGAQTKTRQLHAHNWWDLWAISDKYSHRALELAVRLSPFARIGCATFPFQTRMSSCDTHYDYTQQTLLHHFLTERLHGQRFHNPEETGA